MATATIAMSHGGTSGFPAKEYLKSVGVITRYLDLSKATSIRGSALTAGDQIDLIQLPAGTLILGGTAEVVTAANGTGSFSVGISGGSLNTFVDGAPLTTAGFAAVGSGGSLAYHLAVGSGGKIVSLKLATVDSTTIASGIIRVDIVISEAATTNTPNQS